MNVPKLGRLAPTLLLLAACGANATELPAADAGVPDAGEGTDAGVTADAGPSADAGSTTDAGVGLAPDEVRTAAGVVRGTEADGVWSFKGLPYVAPPVGALRFAAPAPHPGWDEVLDADAFGAVCPQADRRGAPTGDEDCLTLNVWSTRAQTPKPVMVWIHGGGHVQGSASVQIYDGAQMVADGDVVLVSINYRLGALGYLALDALREEAPAGEGANFGLLDQIAALEWVRDNIAGFGGDPGNVTIFGESAGAVSVAHLLAADPARGLFHRAAIESGDGGTSTSPWSRAVGVGAQVLAEVGCDSAEDVKACLRDVDAADLVLAQAAVNTTGLGIPDFGEVLDGVLLSALPYTRIAGGQVPDVPVLVGSNADEAVAFTGAIPVPTWQAFEQTLVGFLGGVLGPQVAALYPDTEFATPKDALNAAFGDVAFNCAAESLARATAGGDQPSFHYYFTHVLNGQAGAQGSLHGHEIPFVFGTFDDFPGYTPTAGDRSVSAAMLAAWTSFAHDGAPSITPEWPAYDSAAASTLVIEDPLSTTEVFRNGRCDSLREIGVVR